MKKIYYLLKRTLKSGIDNDMQFFKDSHNKMVKESGQQRPGFLLI